MTPGREYKPVVLDTPLITPALPGVGGTFNSQNADFFVEEVPLRPFGGKGDHVHFLMEKEGLTTPEALGVVARAIGKRNRDIGYAGLKDAHAVTRQWISIEAIPPDRLLRLKLRNIRILEWARHDQKLKIGQLQGNRFRVRLCKLRCPVTQAEKQAREIFSVLCERGLPNAFGPQRFGNRGNSHLLGKAILLDQRELFLDLLLGDPRSEDNPTEFRVRTLYSQGQYHKALKTCPGHRMDTRRVLRALVKNHGDKGKAFSFVAPSLNRFLVSAYQSFLFNRVLGARMPHIDRLLVGDMAYRHGDGACFQVEDLAMEQPRCNQFEISPSGPIYSLSMPKPSGAAGRIEDEVLEQEQTALLAQSATMKKQVAKGGRRPLRVQPTHVSVSQDRGKYGDTLELKFDLPAGSYATVLLREVMKP